MQLSINAIRMLSIDMINKANSGHPGIAMGIAPAAYALWTKHLKINPDNPEWINRDRFILSAGHGSALLYSLLYLSGFDISIDDLKKFRQLNSKTPGHPEYKVVPGAEATTGPLGQGIAMGVGLAMAQSHLGAKYNSDKFKVFDNYTYVVCSDGDLMEGVGSEASSLAGNLKLGKLIMIYDSNKITLDGNLELSFSENVKNRYKSYDWQVITVEDGNDQEQILRSIEEAKKDETRPSIIIVKTIIGYGSPNKSGKNKAHGSPIGKEETELVKKNYNWNYEEFFVPEEVVKDFRENVKIRGQKEEKKWLEKFEQYKKENFDLYQELQNSFDIKKEIKLEENFLQKYSVGYEDSTRNSGYEILNYISKIYPNLIGGTADVACSTKAYIKDAEIFSHKNYLGQNIYFGIREFAMGSIANGIFLYSGTRVFVSTFFVFSDYLKPALRLSAIMKLPIIYIFSHDSIAVGEDGPTHQPIEQLATIRSIPNVNLIRPANALETIYAYKLAFETNDRPSVLVLTRQNVKVKKEATYEEFKMGGYIISSVKNPLAILIATGSEISLAIDAQEKLLAENIEVSVVSMPSFEIFDRQSKYYKNKVLPQNLRKRLAIEMGSSFGWYKYVGLDGDVLTIDKFGKSGPYKEVVEEYGFCVEEVIRRVKGLLG